MCLILFAHRVHPRFPLILAANRDAAGELLQIVADPDDGRLTRADYRVRAAGPANVARNRKALPANCNAEIILSRRKIADRRCDRDLNRSRRSRRTTCPNRDSNLRRPTLGGRRSEFKIAERHITVRKNGG